MDIDSFTITSNILKILYKQQCELEKISKNKKKKEN